ncbi:MAG: hypothetical protein PHV98_00615 [Candidatus Omnitrophica bacterium]|nr:hypothetical protein [Candidatus Omnitrophota bacterium]
MRGGKRTNAGRKPVPPEQHGKPVLIYLRPHQAEFLDGVNNKSKFIQSVLEEKIMNDKINILLESDGDCGWYFTVTAPTMTTKNDWGRYELSGEVETGPRWYTPHWGGLWNGGLAGKQCLGNCQFGLPANRKKAYAAIRRMVERGDLHTIRMD